jgi:glycosyltransferase involved in cell wall biosynthesis
MRGTILHFSTELGRTSVGGVGTCLEELRRASDEDVGFVLLGPHAPAEPGIVHADFYDMDVLNRLEFDVAVFHYYGLAYLADESFLRGRRLLFVVHSVPTTEPWSLLDPYGGNEAVARAFERLCDAADRIVCVSEAERGKLLTIYPDLLRKTFLIPNGFSAFGNIPLRAAAERKTFGFLGRADERKGLRELLRAFADVDGALRIACGGEDPDIVRAVREDIERLGLEDRVSLVGRVAAADKLAFLRSLDALVVPSRWEPFGYVALEALRAGVTPLVSRQGGLLEIVGADYPFAFDPYRPDAIADCIRRFQSASAGDVRDALERARAQAAPLTAERMAAAYKRAAFAPRAEAAPRGRRFGGAGPVGAPAPGDASATPKARPRPREPHHE